MRSIKTLSVTILCAFIAAIAATKASASQHMTTIPAGTTIMVRILDPIDSSKNKQGDRFTAVLETNLVANGQVVVPAGNTVYGHLAIAEQAGRAVGSSNLVLELTDIVVGGTAYPIFTTGFESKGKGSGGRSAKRLIGGTGLGAIIGGIAGNAGMGAAIGATAGAVGAVAQKGEAIQIPSETLLQFRLQQPASLPSF
jgi:hypothetical protein